MSYYSPKKLKQALEEIEVIASKQLDELYQLSQEQDDSFVEVLLTHNAISEQNLGRLLADITEYPYVQLDQQHIDQKTLQIIPEIVAQKQHVVAFKLDEHGLHVAMLNPGDIQVKEFLEKRTGVPVMTYITFPNQLADAVSLYAKDIEEVFDEIIQENVEEAVQAEQADPPIIRIVDTLIDYAHRNKASDIHIEPLEDKTMVRFRIDGVLHDVVDLPLVLHERIVTRVKVLASLRIDEKHTAQDGKIEVDTAAEELDLRISIVPVTDGEKIVMRLLAERARQYSLEDLGLSGTALKRVRAAYKQPYGMVLSTGPTGSGKTTTLYALLKLLNKRSVNIMTIEDPVEYDLERVNQIQVNNETGLTFAKGLRSVVRQDPDIILVGEIRDEETAGIAINSAMTGHLVLSTLHTNDAATAIPRLVDMEVEPYLVASTVSVVIAQRLVRKICSNCRVSATITIDPAKKDQDADPHRQIARRLLKMLSDEQREEYYPQHKVKFYYGKGCPVCHNSGYRGRVGIFEVLEMSDAVREAVTSGKNASQIKEIALKEGMVSMLEDGLQKIGQGVTTIGEVLRVAQE